MDAIKLEDLIPQGSSFNLKATGKAYRLRPLNLDDEAWLAKTFGADLQAIMSEVRHVEIARIAFRQMEPEDQADFAAREVKLMNEEGETEVVRLGGYRLLLALIQGTAEKIAIYRALLETIGISRPMQDRLMGEEAQKKSELAPVPRAESSSTGESSLISSPVNTDGPLKTSEG